VLRSCRKNGNSLCVTLSLRVKTSLVTVDVMIGGTGLPYNVAHVVRWSICDLYECPLSFIHIPTWSQVYPSPFCAMFRGLQTAPKRLLLIVSPSHSSCERSFVGSEGKYSIVCGKRQGWILTQGCQTVCSHGVEAGGASCLHIRRVL